VELTIVLTPEQVDAIAGRVAELLAERQPTDDSYLDAVEAAEFLSTSRSRVYDLVQLGKLEPVRDGRRLLFRRSALRAYVEGGP